MSNLEVGWLLSVFLSKSKLEFFSKEKDLKSIIYFTFWGTRKKNKVPKYGHIYYIMKYYGRDKLSMDNKYIKSIKPKAILLNDKKNTGV